MNWKAEIEKLLRDQMPYAFPISGTNMFTGESGKRRGTLWEDEFQEALGYILDHIENLIEKPAFFDGYAQGGYDALEDLKTGGATDMIFNKDLSRVGAEKAWLKRGQE